MKPITCTVTEDVAEILNNKDNKSKFVRQAIEKEINRKQKPTQIMITVTFANTGYFTNKELTIVTTAVGNLKEKIIPLLDAVQQIQDVITFLDP